MLRHRGFALLVVAVAVSVSCGSGPPPAAGSSSAAPTTGAPTSTVATSSTATTVTAAPTSTSTGPPPTSPPLTPPTTTASATRIDAGVTHQTLPFGGANRSYRLYVPAAVASAMRAGTPAPLLLSIHGVLDGPDGFSNTDLAEPLADRRGFVVVHPAGLPSGDPDGGGGWNAGGCCMAPKRAGVDDVGFIRAVIDDVSARLAIDPARTYVIGYSNGGMLAYRLACELSDRVTAAGSYAGTLEVPQCRPTRAVPFMHVHSHDDGLVPFGGGPSGLSPRIDNYAFHSVQSSIDAMRAADGCTADASPTRAGEVTTTTWTCADGTAVRLVTLERSGHSWPKGTGQTTALGNDGGFNAMEELWAFLSRFTR